MQELCILNEKIVLVTSLGRYRKKMKVGWARKDGQDCFTGAHQASLEDSRSKREFPLQSEIAAWGGKSTQYKHIT